ncbi:serine--tRNA ligase [Gammaproteobacteria bacterium]|nr:serine--tRNA ligase [Gammaproteobacteria bacterium]
MIPSNYLRQHLAQVESSVQKRGADVDFKVYEQLEIKRKAVQYETEALQAKSNQLSKEVAVCKRQQEDASHLLSELTALSTDKKALEAELRDLKHSLHTFLLGIPNILSDEVPVGGGERDNVVIKTVGEQTSFEYMPKSHAECFVTSMDFVSAAVISGSRFVVLKSQLAKLNRALGQWMLDTQVSRGYQEINPPLLVKPQSLEGTGQLPKFKEDQFFTATDSHALIPTAEVPLTNLHRDSILEHAQLPIAYTALTHCFRSEAGAYGKDTSGMIRQHQFEKVELVKLVSKEQAQSEFEALVGDAEYILQALKLPYRQVLLCSKDTGFSASITYDFEVWMPSEGQYREISSCSYFGSFQGSRMMSRYRDSSRQIHPVHTINGSGLAVGRALIAVIENYQSESGITIPEVLKPYMGGIEFISYD